MTVGGTSSEVVMLGNQIHSSIVLKKESETLCTISIDMSSPNYLVRKYFKQVYAWTQLFWVYFLDLFQVSFRMYTVCTVAVSWKSIFLNFEQDFLASSSFPWSLLKTLNVHQA